MSSLQQSHTTSTSLRPHDPVCNYSLDQWSLRSLHLPLRALISLEASVGCWASNAELQRREANADEVAVSGGGLPLEDTGTSLASEDPWKMRSNEWLEPSGKRSTSPYTIQLLLDK